jgi:MoxR-like ATPase
VLWQAFTADQPVALLIDEIDKADIEFPNDLLRESTAWSSTATKRANSSAPSTGRWCSSPRTTKRNCPTPFCAAASFHFIKFPEADTMRQIVNVHFPTLKSELLGVAMKTFYDVRNLPGLKKKPSTSELIDWLKLLVAEDIPLSKPCKAPTTRWPCHRWWVRC